jgi:hypothetical protein
VITSIAGAGKSEFLSHIIVAFLIGDENARIIVAALSNQLVNVIMSKIDINLEKAKNNDRFSICLANTFTSRAYYDAAELSYLSAKAAREGKENALLKAIFDDDEPIDSDKFLLETKKASSRLSFNEYKD